MKHTNFGSKAVATAAVLLSILQGSVLAYPLGSAPPFSGALANGSPTHSLTSVALPTSGLPANGSPTSVLPTTALPSAPVSAAAGAKPSSVPMPVVTARPSSAPVSAAAGAKPSSVPMPVVTAHPPSAPATQKPVTTPPVPTTAAGAHHRGGHGESGLDSTQCDMANMGTICKGDANCPPCWQRNGNKYDCYSYTPEGECPWNGMWDRNGDKKSAAAPPASTVPSASTASAAAAVSSASAEPTAPAAFCRPGNQNHVPVCTENCPPCWRNEGSYYSCYEKLDEKCPSFATKEVRI